MMSPYLNMLAAFGMNSAHPGGLPLSKQLIEYVNLKDRCSIIDIGCGTGQTVQMLVERGYSVVGIDVHPEMVKHAKDRFQQTKDVRIHELDLLNLKMLKQTFHTALSESVLSFTPLKKSLPAIRDVLEDCGYLLAIEMIITDSLSIDEHHELSSFYGFQQFLAEEEWIATFQKMNFHVMEVIHPHEWVLEEEALSEFFLTDSIEDVHFQTLETHEKLIHKYRDKMNYAMFICKK